MKKEELVPYLDALLTYAVQHTNGSAEAEDLVSETFLRALTLLERGGEIEYPKSWLFSTFDHVWNDTLRKKYRRPVIVELTPDLPLAAEEDPLPDGDEAADVRREVNRLSREYRTVIVRHYWRGESVAEIASAAGIPEGTVKSRLAGGRERIRKGLEKQMMKANIGHAITDGDPDKLPETLRFANSGWADGLQEMIGGDLIAQNALIEAYEKPLRISELSRRLGVPTVYLEPVVQKLAEEKLMKESAGGLVSTDFVIFTVEDQTKTFDAQLAFAKEHFDAIWTCVAEAEEEVAAFPWWETFGGRQKQKMNAHLALRILQSFTAERRGTPNDWEAHYRSTRRGRWLGWGYRYPAGFEVKSMARFHDYQILGGLRSCIRGDVPGTQEFATFAFDTTLFDKTDPYRFALAGDMNTFFLNIGRVLWKAYRGEEPSEDEEIPAAMLEAIPQFIEYGLLARDGNGRLTCDIPLIPQPDYLVLRDRIIAGAVERMDRAVGEDFRAFLQGTKVPVPAHLTDYPQSLRTKMSSDFIAMAAVREAYARGLHLRGVDYCCPAVIGCWLDENG